MVRELVGRRLLVTGASRGIGRYVVEKAATQGARIVCTARNQQLLEELADRLRDEGAKVVPVVADLTSADDRQRLVEQVERELGGLDVLINNAGISSHGHFSTSTEEVLRQIMEVNFFAPVELIRQALPLLREGVQPAVVNVASKCGRCALPAFPEYSASKFALAGMTEALRGEFARFDIDVLLVLPGLTDTELGERMLRHDGRMRIDFAKGMPPQQVADSILEALRKNRADTAVGTDARWLLRVHRFFPRLVGYLMRRKVRKLYEAERRASS